VFRFSQRFHTSLHHASRGRRRRRRKEKRTWRSWALATRHWRAGRWRLTHVNQDGGLRGPTLGPRHARQQRVAGRGGAGERRDRGLRQVRGAHQPRVGKGFPHSGAPVRRPAHQARRVLTSRRQPHPPRPWASPPVQSPRVRPRRAAGSQCRPQPSWGRVPPPLQRPPARCQVSSAGQCRTTS